LKAKTRWYRSTDIEEKEKFKQSLLQSTEVLDRLLEILEGDYESSLAGSESKDALDNPNWEVRQAYAIGERKTLQSIIDLVTLTEE
jgi:hypothetical protein